MDDLDKDDDIIISSKDKKKATRELKQPLMQRMDSGQLESNPILHAPIISDIVETQYEDSDTEADTFKEIRDNDPEGVINHLNDTSLIKLGDIEIDDITVLLAFKNNIILTRGSDTLKDPNYKENWTTELIKRAYQKPNIDQTDIGWMNKIEVSAYAVKIKNVANPGNEGLLHPLIMKVRSGALIPDIFEYLSVRSVVNYKWDVWASRALRLQLFMFIGLFISFFSFAGLYAREYNQQSNPNGQLNEYQNSNGSNDIAENFTFYRGIIPTIFCCSSYIFMIPFAISELLLMYEYKLGWMTFWNVSDLISFVLQNIILIMYIFQLSLEGSMFAIVLALQCFFICLKTQYFIRCLGVGATFITTLKIVIFDSRWFLLFIGLTIFSTTFSLMVLFRGETTMDNKDQELKEYAQYTGFLSTSITVFSYILGDFKTKYLMESHMSTYKMIIFLGYEIVMSIAILNLLIGAMTESYGKLMCKERLLFTFSRAVAIDEMESCMPGSHLHNAYQKAYVHFLIIKKTDELYDSQKDKNGDNGSIKQNNTDGQSSSKSQNGAIAESSSYKKNGKNHFEAIRENSSESSMDKIEVLIGKLESINQRLAMLEK